MLVPCPGGGALGPQCFCTFILVSSMFGVLLSCRSPVLVEVRRDPIVYMRDQLIGLQHSGVFGHKHEIPGELRRRHQGCNAGKRRRLVRRWYRPYLPSIIMGNVRSLANKMDELVALMRSQRVFREASMMFFTDTCLCDNITGLYRELSRLSLCAGRQGLQKERQESGRRRSDLCEHPRHITVKERVCSPDIGRDAHGEDIHALTDCITDYINFCTHNIVPTKSLMLPQQ